MKRRHFVGLIPLSVLAAACGSSTPAGGGNPPPAPPPPPPPPPPPGGIGANMQIVDNAFVDPTGGRNTAATVTINVGQAVRWQNNGNVLHTVTSMAVPAGAASFDSSSMQSGAFFDHTFTMAGTYTYRCDFHPQEMLGSTVIVQ